MTEEEGSARPEPAPGGRGLPQAMRALLCALCVLCVRIRNDRTKEKQG